MRKILSTNIAIGAVIGLANTLIYALLFPLYIPFESFMAFFAFDGSFRWVVMLALGIGGGMLLPNIIVGAVIGGLVSLPRYYRASYWLVAGLAIFSSLFIFRIFLYGDSMLHAIYNGDLYYPAAVVVTTLIYLFAFNRWVIRPTREKWWNAGQNQA